MKASGSKAIRLQRLSSNAWGVPALVPSPRLTTRVGVVAAERAFDDQTVVEGHDHAGRFAAAADRFFGDCGLAGQGHFDRVEARGLALGVAAADDDQFAGRRDLDGFDAFDVFDFEGNDFHDWGPWVRIGVMVSSGACPTCHPWHIEHS